MANEQVVEVGSTIGSFIGGIINPIIGTQKTVETIAPSSSSRTGTIIIAVLAVTALAVVAYILIKNKKSS